MFEVCINPVGNPQVQEGVVGVFRQWLARGCFFQNLVQRLSNELSDF